MSERTPSFPFPAPPFDGGSRAVAAANGLAWLKDGWALFVAAPAQWLALTVILIVFVFCLYQVPLVGGHAVNFATPLLCAGMLVAARKAATGERVEVSELFLTLKPKAKALFSVGALYMAGMLAILFVAFALGGGSVAGGLTMGSMAGLGVALGGVMLALMLSLVLLVPLAMAIWFAPALVLFNNMGATDALKASFTACLRNALPFVLYSLFLLVLCFFALLPVGLGLLVLTPVVFASIYAAYRDVFVAD